MRVITGTARGTNLKAPDGLLTRPTADKVKQALFNIIQYEIVGDVLDLGTSGDADVVFLKNHTARIACALFRVAPRCRRLTRCRPGARRRPGQQQ